MQARSDCSWLWMMAAVVTTSLIGFVVPSRAIAESTAVAFNVSQGMTPIQADEVAAIGSPASIGTFESLLAGVVDAGIPTEMLQSLALHYGASSTEYAQAVPVDDIDREEGEEVFEEEVLLEYDPWERFNRTMFSFNRQVDRLILKPVATAWDTVIPDLMQQSFANFFANLGMPRRLVNNLLQAKFKGAGKELARFFINISMGVVGFFDAAADLGIERSDEDTGQTMGVYGVGPGPYLILPFLPPLTVRDGIGFGLDGAMDPLTYLLPFSASAGRRGGEIVNDRALNLETFEEFERAAFDLYTAVRNAYLQRRQKMIQE